MILIFCLRVFTANCMQDIIHCAWSLFSKIFLLFSKCCRNTFVKSIIFVKPKNDGLSINYQNQNCFAWFSQSQIFVLVNKDGIYRQRPRFLTLFYVRLKECQRYNQFPIPYRLYLRSPPDCWLYPLSNSKSPKTHTRSCYFIYKWFFNFTNCLTGVQLNAPNIHLSFREILICWITLDK